VVAAPGLTVIDTPIFVIDLRYRRDRKFFANRALLDRIAQVTLARRRYFTSWKSVGFCFLIWPATVSRTLPLFSTTLQRRGSFPQHFGERIAYVSSRGTF
jgi:hypothetical protein